MSRNNKTAFQILAFIGIILIWAAGGVARADVVVSGSFGPNGDVGFVHSPPGLSITFGPDNQGLIYQMDGFVNASNINWSGGISGSDPSGTSGQLTDGPPPGIGYTFSASQPTVHQLLLTYTFHNTGPDAQGFQFLYYVDPDTLTGNDWATSAGTPGFGLTTYQVGDPQGSIFFNLDNGTLNNVNDYPSMSQTGNVAMALGFSFGDFAPRNTAAFQVLLSDDGSKIGSFSLTDHTAADLLTLSGQQLVVSAPTPEPSSLVLYGTGLILLALALAHGKRC
jgi:hypothetical protein